MSDNPRLSDNPPVVTDEISTLDGVAVTPAAQLQGVMLMRNPSDGFAQRFDPITLATDQQVINAVTLLGQLVSELQGTLLTADNSSPLTRVLAGGADFTGATSVQMVAQRAARSRVEVSNAGTARVWLGFGQAAVIGQGAFLEPGQTQGWWTTDRVEVLVASGTQRVTFTEWVAT